jgi:hypothetical protein
VERPISFQDDVVAGPLKLQPTAVERRMPCQDDAMRLVPLKTHVTEVERHVTFQDDTKPNRFAHAAHHCFLHRRSKTVLPLRSALRKRSKIAIATPDMQLMSLCLPLLVAILWCLFCFMFA